MSAELKRNIVVIGKTGCGKSTIANKILCADDDNRIFGVENSFRSITTKATNVICYVRIGSTTYTINMIDTIGFSDTRNETRNEVIMDETKKEIQDRAPEGINLLIFVFKHGRFTDEERVTFDKIQKKFSDLINIVSLLVITNCELLTKAAREKVITDFKTDPLIKDFAKMMTKGIFTVGFPDTKSLNPMIDKSAVIQIMRADIALIHRIIASASNRFLQYEFNLDDNFWLQIATVCNYV